MYTEYFKKKISDATKRAMSALTPEKRQRLSAQKGKKWFKCSKTREDGLFLPGSEPEGWVPGRFARGKTGGNWGLPKWNAPKKNFTLSEKMRDAAGEKCPTCGRPYGESYHSRLEWHHVDLHHWEPGYHDYGALLDAGRLVPLCHDCHMALHGTRVFKGGKKPGLRGPANGMWGRSPPNKLTQEERDERERARQERLKSPEHLEEVKRHRSEARRGRPSPMRGKRYPRVQYFVAGEVIEGKAAVEENVRRLCGCSLPTAFKRGLVRRMIE